MALQREILQNNSATTLNGAITNIATSVTVTAGAVFPATGDFRVIVNDEIMLVTARATNVLTVVRGQEGTSNQAQSSGDIIKMLLTDGALDAFGQDENYLYDSARPPHRLLDASGNTLTGSSFTNINLSTTTKSDGPGRAITVRKPTHGGENVSSFVRTAPSAPYIVRACFTVSSLDTEPAVGLVFRESSTSKLYVFAHTSDTNGTHKVVVWRYTNDTTFLSTLVTRTGYLGPMPIWLEIEDNNTNVLFRVSHDGINFVTLGAGESRTAHMAGAPNQVGFMIFALNTVHDNLASLVSWDEAA